MDFVTGWLGHVTSHGWYYEEVVCDGTSRFSGTYCTTYEIQYAG